MEWFFAIAALLAVGFCVIVFADKITFDKKIQNIEQGMTGKQIENKANLKLDVIRIEGNTYYAKIYSPLKMFKYQLLFKDGKLLQKHRV